MDEWKIAKIKKISDTVFRIEFIDGEKCLCQTIKRNGRTVGLTLVNKEYVRETVGMDISDDFADYVLGYVGDILDDILNPIYKNLENVLWAGIEDAAEKYNIELPG